MNILDFKKEYFLNEYTGLLKRIIFNRNLDLNLN